MNVAGWYESAKYVLLTAPPFKLRRLVTFLDVFIICKSRHLQTFKSVCKIQRLYVYKSIKIF